MTDNCFCEIFHTENGYFNRNGNIVATNEDMRYSTRPYTQVVKKWVGDPTIPNEDKRYAGIDILGIPYINIGGDL